MEEKEKSKETISNQSIGRRSENEQVVEFIFEIVFKEINYIKEAFTSVCNNLAGQFSEVLSSMKGIGDSVTSIIQDQKDLKQSHSAIISTVDEMSAQISSLKMCVDYMQVEIDRIKRDNVNLTCFIYL